MHHPYCPVCGDRNWSVAKKMQYSRATDTILKCLNCGSKIFVTYENSNPKTIIILEK